ncbi:DUF6898 family protein [Oleisolibacter albus]|uniref:DUF6898 family protein n=1 Tax=Oleisolibacter albus TaxID=2171757 RepID=UPI000DF18571|nr:hypothetical protein [Oleisolibacter albus]
MAGTVPGGRPLGEQDVLLEFQQIGAAVRVAAIDPRTGTEVVISGPSRAGRAALVQTALRKLNYMLSKAGP